jgi:hypothetical protein
LNHNEIYLFSIDWKERWYELLIWGGQPMFPAASIRQVAIADLPEQLRYKERAKHPNQQPFPRSQYQQLGQGGSMSQQPGQGDAMNQQQQFPTTYTAAGLPVNSEGGIATTKLRDVFVKNLAYSVDSDSLNQALREWSIKYDDTRKLDFREVGKKYCVLIPFETYEESDKAAKILHGKTLKGRVMDAHVDRIPKDIGPVIVRSPTFEQE